ncbi:hypothetical protein HK405_006613, partial [Cladochytrium tenue]
MDSTSSPPPRLVVLPTAQPLASAAVSAAAAAAAATTAVAGGIAPTAAPCGSEDDEGHQPLSPRGGGASPSPALRRLSEGDGASPTSHNAPALNTDGPANADDAPPESTSRGAPCGSPGSPAVLVAAAEDIATAAAAPAATPDLPPLPLAPTVGSEKTTAPLRWAPTNLLPRRLLPTSPGVPPLLPPSPANAAAASAAAAAATLNPNSPPLPRSAVTTRRKNPFSRSLAGTSVHLHPPTVLPSPPAPPPPIPSVPNAAAVGAAPASSLWAAAIAAFTTPAAVAPACCTSPEPVPDRALSPLSEPLLHVTGRHTQALLNCVAASAHAAVAGVVNDLSAALLACSHGSGGGASGAGSGGGHHHPHHHHQHHLLTATAAGLTYVHQPTQPGEADSTLLDPRLTVEEIVDAFADSVRRAARAAARSFITSHHDCTTTATVAATVPTDTAVASVVTGPESSQLVAVSPAHPGPQPDVSDATTDTDMAQPAVQPAAPSPRLQERLPPAPAPQHYAGTTSTGAPTSGDNSAALRLVSPALPLRNPHHATSTNLFSARPPPRQLAPAPTPAPSSSHPDAVATTPAAAVLASSAAVAVPRALAASAASGDLQPLRAEQASDEVPLPATAELNGSLAVMTPELDEPSASPEPDNGPSSMMLEMPGIEPDRDGTGSLLLLEPGGRFTSGQRGLVCPTCSKGFSRRYNLRTHMASHLDVRPHQCSVCGSSFAR